MPRIAGGKDRITQPLYDTQNWLAATTSLTFFTTPLGSGTSVYAAIPKTISDTNMRLAGQLPSPWTFELMSIQIALNSNVLTADAILLLDSIALTLVIGAKTFFEYPGKFLTGGAGVEGYAAGAVAGEHSAHNGVGDPRAIFVIDTIQLLENENFQIIVTAPAAIAVSATVRMQLVLGGYLSRGIQ